MNAVLSLPRRISPPETRVRRRTTTVPGAPIVPGGGISTLEVTTLVVWLGCLAVGGLGLAWAYPRPVSAPKPPPPTVAEILHVELTQDPLPSPAPMLAGAPTPPPLASLPSAPSLPSLAAVAEPSPAMAFALPVEGPARVVDVREASYAQGTATTNTASVAGSSGPGLPVQSLVYGQGDGRQPAPRYPSRARNAGQEGTVVVRLSVGENGRVQSAEAAQPSPWPLLNEEAVRAVRDTWRFQAGTVRLYDVAIRFQLTQ